MGKHFGKCALCRKECDLSFEHIPPRSAFNSIPARPVSGEDLIRDNDRLPWDVKGLHYDHQQKGMGKYSLCEDCNNNTGSWYGNAYAQIAHLFHNALLEPISNIAIGLKVKGVYPLQFIKQVASMFCSVNNFDDERFVALRQFVLDKEAVGLDKSKYKICMYFTRSHFMKYVPMTAVLTGPAHGSNRFGHILVSEITAYPLGFVLFINPSDTYEYEGFDITCFADWKYEARALIDFPLYILEVNDIFPTFYRTKEEICNTIDENKKRAEELEWQKEENTN